MVVCDTVRASRGVHLLGSAMLTLIRWVSIGLDANLLLRRLLAPLVLVELLVALGLVQGVVLGPLAVRERENNRYGVLAEKKVVPEAEFDKVRTQYRLAQGEVARIQAQAAANAGEPALSMPATMRKIAAENGVEAI